MQVMALFAEDPVVAGSPVVASASNAVKVVWRRFFKGPCGFLPHFNFIPAPNGPVCRHLPRSRL